MGRISLDTFFSVVSGSESDWFSTPLDLLRVMALFLAYLELFRDTELAFLFPETIQGCISVKHQITLRFKEIFYIQLYTLV